MIQCNICTGKIKSVKIWRWYSKSTRRVLAIGILGWWFYSFLNLRMGIAILFFSKFILRKNHAGIPNTERVQVGEDLHTASSINKTASRAQDTNVNCQMPNYFSRFTSLACMFSWRSNYDVTDKTMMSPNQGVLRKIRSVNIARHYEFELKWLEFMASFSEWLRSGHTNVCKSAR